MLSMEIKLSSFRFRNKNQKPKPSIISLKEKEHSVVDATMIIKKIYAKDGSCIKRSIPQKHTCKLLKKF
jgi:hypothetical protein